MKNGKRIVLLRRITLATIFVAVIASLAFDLGLGTPSSFGIGQFNVLCPLGGIEAMLASKSFLPSAAISAAVVLIFVLLFGRAWCAWGCPAPAIRSFFRRKQKGNEDATAKEAACPSGGCGKNAGFKSIAYQVAHDRRLWVLVGVLLVTFIVGFPIFCLVCPIGLTFGTVSSLWHLIIDKQVTLSVIVFPLALLVELVVYRKWCINLCPIAGLLNLFGRFAKLFRPRVDASTCLRYNTNKQCDICARVCAESINLHTADASQALGECTRCGECMKHCPTNSISIKVKPSEPVTK